ncbi:MAG: hypothetical protein ACK4YL_24900 [Microcystis sp.]|uniref:hypothetical protein n=1 Tax=unclassified Microcystis TaxID=2643300 RepID=UPI0022C0FE13|nr:hypothetical protein [Microcystis sp. M49636_WE2]MCZ8056923.1 hypothetical protein [Microcystis sp. LE19-12.2C]MDJ0552299.1 hypothetical protein [Microcystis sp. M49637_WE12]MDJ0585380.1 hypothetical protein [Microcystis sp. M49636_WE2]
MQEISWNATTTWTSDAWNTTTKWTSDAWNATTKWVSDLWPFSSSSDFLSVTAFNEMNSDSINLQQTLINNPWQAIAQWTPEAWEATTHWRMRHGKRQQHGLLKCGKRQQYGLLKCGKRQQHGQMRYGKPPLNLIVQQGMKSFSGQLAMTI